MGSQPTAPISSQPPQIPGSQQTAPNSSQPPLPPSNQPPVSIPRPVAAVAPTAPLGMFQRRIGRGGFFLGFIYLLVVSIVPFFIEIAVMRAVASNPALVASVNIFIILFVLAELVLFLPVSISLYVRRLHDINQSGILWLLTFIPFFNFLLFIFLLFAPGTAEPNNYGDPVESNAFWVVIGFKKPRQTHIESQASLPPVSPLVT